jgi:hypothetical protein
MLLIYGKDGTPEVRKSTLWTSYWESIGSQFFKLVFCGNLREREQSRRSSPALSLSGGIL